MYKVYYIDDNFNSRILYRNILKRMFGPEVLVESIEPIPHLSKMLKFILSVDDLVSLIIDERMNENGIAEYTGMELVEEIRKIKTKIPIYILTSYPGEVSENLFDIEYVINKDNLNDELEKEYTSRFRRHIGLYSDILSERNQRYNDLLSKSFDESLTSEEASEFFEIDKFRNKSLYYDDPIISKELEDRLLKQNEKINELLKKIESLDDEDDILSKT